jgi:hypothetical protein
MTQRSGSEGSRYVYDSFDAASARIEANERVAQERWAALDYRLGQIDAVLERLEKRIWLGVYGVAAFLLAQMAETLLRAAGK